MLHYATPIRRGLALVAAQADVFVFEAPFDGKIKSLRLSSGSNASTSDAIFDLNLDGASIFTAPTRPHIAVGTRTVEVALDVAVTLGQPISLDLDSVDASGIGAPLSMHVTFDDAGSLASNSILDYGLPAGSHTLNEYFRLNSLTNVWEWSTEVLIYNKLIDDLYSEALNRAATTLERTTQTTALQTAEGSYIAFKAAVRNMISVVFNSAEYAALGTSDAVFIEDLYRASLGRPSDATGFSTWSTFLSSHTRAQTVAAFIISDELTIERLGRAWWQKYANADAASVRGILFPTGLPSVGDTILYNADGTWHYGAASGAPSGAAGGDLLSNYPNPTVAKIQNRAVNTMPAPSVISDNFNDNSLDGTYWTVVTDFGSFAETNQRLQMIGTTTGGREVINGPLHDWTGRTAQIVVTNVLSTGSSAKNYFALVTTANGILNVNESFAAFYIYNDGSGMRLVGQHFRFTVANDTIFNIAYDATAHKYLRFRHDSSANLLYWETSPDGATWTARGNSSTTQSGAINITSQRICFFIQPDAQAYFDDYLTTVPAQDIVKRGDTLAWDDANNRFTNTAMGQLPTITAAPAVAPTILTGFTKAYYNTTDNKIYVWNPVAAVWKSTAALT